jgi:hypothetical protein
MISCNSEMHFKTWGRMMKALGQVTGRSHAKPFGNKTKLAESTDTRRGFSLSRTHGAEIRASSVGRFLAE